LRCEIKYTIGVDFGTESGRAVLVDVSNGYESATSVHPYANSVTAERLLGSSFQLEPDWALQDPNDYLEVFKQTIPAVLKASGVDTADVTGREFKASGSTQTSTLGSAMFGELRLAKSAAVMKVFTMLPRSWASSRMKLTSPIPKPKLFMTSCLQNTVLYIIISGAA